MILVISPAKRLDFKNSAPSIQGTKPLFLLQAKEVIRKLRRFSPMQLSKLLSLGEKLAETSWERHQNWSDDCENRRCKAAVFAYRGDVYQGMQPENFQVDQMSWMQEHLRILSAVYGVLKPFDLIQPYRLQMDARLAVNGYHDLYDFWQKEINDTLASHIREDPDHTLVNLASDEYFKTIDSKKIYGRIVKPVFRQYTNGKYKVVSFHVKRARGMMCRFIIENRLTKPEHLKLFDMGNYLFSMQHSNENQWVFLRG